MSKCFMNWAFVYEMMHQYDKAKEVIEPLELLGEDTYNLKKFLELSQITSSKSMSIEDKVNTLKQLLEDEPNLYRQVISVLLQLNTQVAWETIDMEHIGDMLDIFWFLPNSQVDLDIISSNNTLHTLYYAKGYLQKPPKEKSGIFTLDMLATARKGWL